MKSIAWFLFLLALLALACSLPVLKNTPPVVSSPTDELSLPGAAPQKATEVSGASIPQATLPGTILPPATLTFSDRQPTPTLRPPTQAPPAFPDCQPANVAPYSFDPGRITPMPRPVGEAPGLRHLAEGRGLLVGASSAPSQWENPQYASLMTREFNLLTAENAMKWEVIHPAPEGYDFRQGDALVDYARANGLSVRGHTLVWDLQQPAWLLEAQHTREEWIQILCRHIKTVAGHYRGQIYAWDVVNEAFQSNGELRDTHWLRAIGPEYIAMAFYWARQADPQALLIYNDFEAEGLNEKSDAIYSLVQGLQQQGIPLDGVGLQMHVWLWGPPTPAELRANMQRLAALGLQAHITEMDVRLQYSPDNETQELAAQAEIYQQAMQACLDTLDPLGQPACRVFTTWGLTDRYSWIPDYTGHPDAPLLFDKDAQPKPAYWAVYETLK